MKTRMFVVVAFALAMLLSQTAVAQVVHYEGGKGGKAPDFREATFAIDFTGNVAADLREAILRKGSASFVERVAHPCDISQPVVCISFAVRDAGSVSGAGGMSGNGRSGGYATQSSFTGRGYAVEVRVILLRPSTPPFTLGICSVTEYAGSGQGITSSFGRSGGGTFNEYGTSSQSQAVGAGVKGCVERLFSNSGINRFRYAGPVVHWYGGGAEEVKKTFHP